jgi:nicotinamidase-related amidase
MTRMHCDRSQILVIDIQERLLPTVREPERVTAACARLIQAGKRLGVPVTVSEQYPKGIGPTVEPLRVVMGNDVPVLEKTHFSCLRNDGLRDRVQALRTAGRNQIVLAGIEAHICVMQTALDLIAAGLSVFVAADGISSRTGAVIADSEMAIFEWLERAGTPEFKDLLPLFK